MEVLESIEKKFGVEMALVILTCRVHFGTATTQELEKFINRADINWKTVLTLCQVHNIRPVIYKTLSKVNLPQHIAGIIKKEYFKVTLYSWKQAAETERLITLLNDNGIRSLPYKGSAFSMQFYGSPLYRESSDIDIIIKREDLDTLITVLEANGYLSDEGSRILYRELNDNFFRYFKEYNFVKTKDGLVEFQVEFHWSIIDFKDTVNFDTKKLIDDRSNSIVIHQKTLNAIEANAHYLSVFVHHAVTDELKSLKILIDLNQVKQQLYTRMDWDLIQEEIAGMHLIKHNAISDKLVCDLFGGHLNNNDIRISNQKASQLIQKTLSYKGAIKGFEYSIASLKYRFYANNSLIDKCRSIFAFTRFWFVPKIDGTRLFRLSPRFLFLYRFFWRFEFNKDK